MAAYKCKMCGNTIETDSGATVGKCRHCGSKQTFPKLGDDHRTNLYERANLLRRENEYDKAASLYAQLKDEDPSDPEAYWSLVLCRYGIEYIEGPATHKRVPSVNRLQYTSIFDDENYKAALDHSENAQRAIYIEQASAINKIYKGMFSIAEQEDSYDVFICCKDIDENGKRILDSFLGNELYQQLTQEGIKVFFPRASLEDKLGTTSEPYIFAALNSAKVMVVIGTNSANLNDVWVKNEWGRYLDIVKHSKGKKKLIPAYKDMDPSDMPEGLSSLETQEIGKLGLMQELIRKIKRIVEGEDEFNTETKEKAGSLSAPDFSDQVVDSSPKRAEIFFEGEEWSEEDEYYEKIQRIEKEKKEEAVRLEKERKKKIRIKALTIAAGIIIATLVGLFVYFKFIQPSLKESGEKEKFENAVSFLRTAKKGDSVFFGSFNDIEEIEWMVLDVKDNRALLISKSAITRNKFNIDYKPVNWTTSKIREWLNVTFYYDTFITEEWDRIMTTNVKADPNPNYETDQGENCEDHLFLLSIKEAEKYFTSDEERICTDQSGKPCWWWLRTCGNTTTNAVYVDDEGSIYSEGGRIDGDIFMVRPAFWLSLK